MPATPTVFKKQTLRQALPQEPPAPAGVSGARTATEEPTARIIEQNEQVVLVEVACPCGRRTLLACTPAGHAEQGPAQTDPSEV